MLNKGETTSSTLSCSLLPLFDYISCVAFSLSGATLDRQEPFSCTESWTHHLLYLSQG